MKLYFKGRDKQFNAIAEYLDGQFYVLKGSRVSKEYRDNLCNAAIEERIKLNLQEDKQTIITTIPFKSASAAAQFVSGHMTNGLRAWKLENGNSLGTIEGISKRKSRKVK